MMGTLAAVLAKKKIRTFQDRYMATVTGDPVWDAIGTITIGLLLGAIAILLAMLVLLQFKLWFGEGGVADVTVIDTALALTVNAQQLVSKSKNTPFDGWTMKGAALCTIVGGKIAYQR